MSERTYSLLGLWPIVDRWKKLVGIALAVALIGSLVVALLLPNIYSSTAVFFPTNPQSTDPDRIVDGEKLELENRAEDLDRVITIGESQPVAELMIRRFDLYNHYGVGQPGDPKADEAVLREFSDNLRIVHNERDAIELMFEDTDKQLAARMANTMVQVIDSVNQQLTLENRRNVLGLFRQRFEFLDAEFERSRRQLVQARRRYGIFNEEMQSRYLAREIIEIESKLRQAEGGSGNATALRRSLRGLTHTDGGNLVNFERYTQGLDSVQLLTARIEDLEERLVKARGDYEIADVAIRGKLSSLYVVQKAYPAVRQSKPVRWLIVAGAVSLTLILSIVLITLLELLRRVQRPATLTSAA